MQRHGDTVSIYGTFIRTTDDDPVMSKHVNSWDIESVAFKRARLSLDDARTDLAYRSPCQQDVLAYDTPSTNPVIPSQYARRVARASAGCMTCRVFTQCDRLLKTINVNEPIVSGVVAGHLIDPTPSGDAVRKILQMPARPEKEAHQ